MANYIEKQVVETQNLYESVPAWVKEQLNRIEAKLDKLQREEVTIMATIQDVLAKVQEQTTVDQSMFVLIDGLKTQIADALAKIGTLTPEQQAAIDQVFTTAQQNVADVAAKVLENTPAAPPA